VVGVALERVAELPRPLCRSLTGLLLLGAFGLDASGCFAYGQAAEFVGFGVGRGRSRASLCRLAVWIGDAHAHWLAAHSFGSVLTDQ
jgi:hypothetical protein